MLHNEARNFLVEAYEKTHDAKAVALAYGICVPTVYRLAEQKVKTGCVDLRVSKQGRKRVLTPEDSEKIAKGIDGQPDITLSEIVEKLSLPIGIETVRRKIQAMGYRRKKKMIHASGQKRPLALCSVKEMFTCVRHAPTLHFCLDHSRQEWKVNIQ